MKKIIKGFMAFVLMISLFGFSSVKADEINPEETLITENVRISNIMVSYDKTKRKISWNAPSYPGSDSFDIVFHCTNVLTGKSTSYYGSGRSGSVQTTFVKGQKYSILTVARYWRGEHILYSAPAQTNTITG